MIKFGFEDNDDLLSEIMKKMKKYDKGLGKLVKYNVNNNGFVCKILRIKNG